MSGEGRRGAAATGQSAGEMEASKKEGLKGRLTIGMLRKLILK